MQPHIDSINLDTFAMQSQQAVSGVLVLRVAQEQEGERAAYVK